MRVLIATLLFFAIGCLAAETFNGRELAKKEADLSAQFEKYKRDAARPIAQAYISKLEALMKGYAENKDYDAAKRLLAKINEVKCQYAVNEGLAAANKTEPAMTSQERMKREIELAGQFEKFKYEAFRPIAQVYVSKLDALMNESADKKEFDVAARLLAKLNEVKSQYSMDAVSLARTSWLTIFKSDDPSIWGKDTDAAAPNFAMAAAKIPNDIRYLSISMSGEKGKNTVIIPISKDILLKNVDIHPDFMWIGANTRVQTNDGRSNYFLGIANKKQACGYKGQYTLVYRDPPQASRATGYGGWGFGRVALVFADQAYVWNGQWIGKTPFEIAVKTGELTAEEKANLLFN